MKNSSDAIEEKHHPCWVKSCPVVASSTARRAGGAGGALGAIAHGRMWMWRAHRWSSNLARSLHFPPTGSRWLWGFLRWAFCGHTGVVVATSGVLSDAVANYYEGGRGTCFNLRITWLRVSAMIEVFVYLRCELESPPSSVWPWHSLAVWVVLCWKWYWNKNSQMLAS